MPHDLDHIIFTLSTRPQMLTGDLHIISLGYFIMGYFYGKSDEQLQTYERRFRDEFHQWTAKKYNCSLNQSWANIIYFYEGDADKSIEKFVALYHQFREEI